MPPRLQGFKELYSVTHDPTQGLGTDPTKFIQDFPDITPDIFSGIEYFLGLLNPKMGWSIPAPPTSLNWAQSLLSGFNLTGTADTSPNSFLEQLVTSMGGTGGELADIEAIFSNVPQLDTIVGAITGDAGDITLLQNYFAGLNASTNSLLEQLIAGAGGSGSSLDDWNALWQNIGATATGIINALIDDGENFINQILAPWIGSGPNSLLTGPTTPLDANNLFNPINPALLSMVPVAAVGDGTPNFLANPGFDTSASVVDQAGQGWHWVGTDGHSNNGCAAIAAAGVWKTLESNAVPVSANQQIPMSIWAKWIGATSINPSSNDIQLNVRAYQANLAGNLQLVSTTTLQAFQSPSGNSNAPLENNFQQLLGSFTVPAGVDHVSMQLAVSPNVTAGTVEFDDGSISATGLLPQNLVQDLTNAWNNLFGVGNNPTTAQVQPGSVANVLGQGSLGDDVQAIIDYTANSFGHTGTGHTLAQLETYFGIIPPTNVANVLGQGSLGADVQAIIDYTANSFGHTGTGHTLAQLEAYFGIIPPTNLAPVLGGANLGDDLSTTSGTVDTHLNNVVLQLLGIPVTTQQTTDDAAIALGNIFNTLTGLSTQIQNQTVQILGNSQSGQSMLVNFANYPTGAFPNIFSLTNTGTGTGHLIMSSGRATWQQVNDGDVSSVALYTGNVTFPTVGRNITDTDFQELQATLASFPGVGAKNFALLRMSADKQTYVYGVVFLNSSLQLQWELGCYVSGVKHVLRSGTNAPLALSFIFRAGVSGDPYRFQGVAAQQIVFDITDTLHVSQVGSSYRGWGFRSDTASSGQSIPASAAWVGCADNAPVSVVGSGFRASSTVTTNTNSLFGANTAQRFPGLGSFGFFDTIDAVTPDIVPGVDGSARSQVTVGIEGWYDLTLRAMMQFSASLGMVTITGGIFQTRSGVTTYIQGIGNGVAFNIAGGQDCTSALSSAITLYCKVGDILQPGYWIDGVGTPSGLTFVGDANGQNSFWTANLGNKSLQ